MNKDFTFHPEIDKETILTYLGDDIEYIKSIFELFLEQIPKELESIKSLSENGSWEEAGKVAHKIKPTFIMVGFPKYESILKEFELNAKSLTEQEKLNAMLAELTVSVTHAVAIVSEDFSRINNMLENES